MKRMPADASRITNCHGQRWAPGQNTSSKATQLENVMEAFRNLFERYNSRIQSHPTQISLISGAICTRDRACNFLVFGLGNDSPMWVDINRFGRTLFVENDPKWFEVVKEQNPSIDARLVDYGDVSVVKSLADPMTIIKSANPPDFLREQSWDVILIDGPRGYKPHHPGRAIPICWSAMIKNRQTDIFIDDANRDLERLFSDLLLRPGASNTVTVPRPSKASYLLWIMGNQLPNRC
jgi:hypothetical protein